MEILASQVADVECLSRLPSKEEGFDLLLYPSCSLSQLVMSGGKETNIRHFFKRHAYPSYEFILSLGFSRKEGKSAFSFSSLDQVCNAGQYSSSIVVHGVQLTVRMY